MQQRQQMKTCTLIMPISAQKFNRSLQIFCGAEIEDEFRINFREK